LRDELREAIIKYGSKNSALLMFSEDVLIRLHALAAVGICAGDKIKAAELLGVNVATVCRYTTPQNNPISMKDGYIKIFTDEGKFVPLEMLMALRMKASIDLCENNMKKAAELLGVSQATIYRWKSSLEKYTVLIEASASSENELIEKYLSSHKSINSVAYKLNISLEAMHEKLYGGKTDVMPLFDRGREPGQNGSLAPVRATKLIKALRKLHTLAAIEFCGGDKEAAAKLLGKSTTALYRNIEPEIQPLELTYEWKEMLTRTGKIMPFDMLIAVCLSSSMKILGNDKQKVAGLFGLSTASIHRRLKWAPLRTGISDSDHELVSETIFRLSAPPVLPIKDNPPVEAPEPVKQLKSSAPLLMGPDGKMISSKALRKLHTLAAIELSGGDIKDAAELLGESIATLYRNKRPDIQSPGLTDEWRRALIRGENIITFDLLAAIHLKAALEICEQDKIKAAKLLGVSAATVYRNITDLLNTQDQVSMEKWEEPFIIREPLKKYSAMPMSPAQPRNYATSDQGVVQFINWIWSEKVRGLDDRSLMMKTSEFKSAIRCGASLSRILPEAFAVFKEAAFRVTGRSGLSITLSDEQISAAIYLHLEKAVEMEPGEGKTLAIAMAAYLNALAGKGVWIHTFNDYLAKRDGQNMGKIFDALGLSTGVIVDRATYIYDVPGSNQETWIENLKPLIATMRGRAYGCDITYGSKEEFVFDYLKDNSSYNRDYIRQRESPPQMIIVDEADSTLLDEACDPLILSGKSSILDAHIYSGIYDFSIALQEGPDYNLDRQNEAINITESAKARIDSHFTGKRFLKTIPKEERIRLVRQALMARIFYHAGERYVVRDAGEFMNNGHSRSGVAPGHKRSCYKVIIVDEFTGRLKPSHIWADHLHQFVEAKESIEINQPSFAARTDTYQCYYRRMKAHSKLAAASGTIGEDGSSELADIYDLQSVYIQPRYPSLRKDAPERVFNTEKEKAAHVIQRIKTINGTGNPIIVYVSSIKAAKELSEELRRIGVVNNVLDGCDLNEEPKIIEKAGRMYAVTVATKAAGRGIHIELKPGVKELGGLVIMITYRNPSRRIDDQLKRRTARRGMPGWTEIYTSWEDELLKRFGDTNTQEVSEQYHKDRRKTAFDYDMELEDKREWFYSFRKECLVSEPCSNELSRKLKKMDALWEGFLESVYEGRDTKSLKEYHALVEERFEALKASMVSTAEHIPAETKPPPDVKDVTVACRIFEYLCSPDVKGALTEEEIARGIAYHGRDLNTILYQNILAIYRLRIIDTHDKDGSGNPGMAARWFVPENVKNRSDRIRPVLSRLGNKAAVSWTLSKLLPDVKKILAQNDQPDPRALKNGDDVLNAGKPDVTGGVNSMPQIRAMIESGDIEAAIKKIRDNAAAKQMTIKGYVATIAQFKADSPEVAANCDKVLVALGAESIFSERERYDLFTGGLAFMGFVNTFAVGKAPEILRDGGAVQCNYLIAYDDITKVGALAHVNFNELIDEEPRRKDLLRITSAAVKTMIERICGMGAEPERLTFIIVRNGMKHIAEIEKMSLANFKLLEDTLTGLGYVPHKKAVPTSEISFDLSSGVLYDHSYKAVPIELPAPPAVPAKPILTTEEVVKGIHDENMKIEYMPTVLDKAILCHIITDSIVPDGQQKMLKVSLEQNMEKEAAKGIGYKEGFACLSGANAGNSREYVRDLQNLMKKKRDDYRALGYTDVRFGVACPDTGLVSAVIGSNLGVKALAFKPCNGDDFNIVQVEGIMLALRALDSGDIKKLKTAFARLAGGNKLSPEHSAITTIDQFVETVSFILPAAKIENYGEHKRINDLITANIKQAA